jgi:hypothetical protein
MTRIEIPFRLHNGEKKWSKPGTYLAYKCYTNALKSLTHHLALIQTISVALDGLSVLDDHLPPIKGDLRWGV